jgi:hypothetical protein
VTGRAVELYTAEGTPEYRYHCPDKRRVTYEPAATPASLIIYLGLVTDYGLDGRGSIPGSDKIFLSSPQRPDRVCGPPNLLSSGHRGCSLGVKWPRREAYHPPLPSAEVKNGNSYTPTPP